MTVQHVTNCCRGPDLDIWPFLQGDHTPTVGLTALLGPGELRWAASHRGGLPVARAWLGHSSGARGEQGHFKGRQVGRETDPSWWLLGQNSRMGVGVASALLVVAITEIFERDV